MKKSKVKQIVESFIRENNLDSLTQNQIRELYEKTFMNEIIPGTENLAAKMIYLIHKASPDVDIQTLLIGVNSLISDLNSKNVDFNSIEINSVRDIVDLKNQTDSKNGDLAKRIRELYINKTTKFVDAWFEEVKEFLNKIADEVAELSNRGDEASAREMHTYAQEWMKSLSTVLKNKESEIAQELQTISEGSKIKKSDLLKIIRECISEELRGEKN